MPQYNRTLAKTLPPELMPGADPDLAWHAVLDLPYMLRFQGLRITTFAGSAALTRDPRMKEAAQEGLQGALRFYDAVAEILRDPAKVLAEHPDSADLIRRANAANPAALAAIDGFRERAGTLVAAVTDGSVDGAALDTVLRHTYDVFAPQMEGMVRFMSGCNRRRTQAARDATATGRTDAAGACTEIRAVARTIRTISLNAAVEAARAGEAGRAFGVIAVEIRTLSEQAARASARIGEAVEAMAAGGRGTS